ncbi:MAG: hypothetical protein J6M19_00615 [Bacteroidaceae bacterium]|nr:hypothetical protein [Bacteroidaceae bacterium]
MNFSFYLTGTLEGQYSQYPNDYTASTLAGLQANARGARLVIYREMDLIHYAYTERLSDKSLIGFCLIFNKARIQKPRQLIKLFRFIIEKRLVESGEVIKYNHDGELTFKVKSMNECIKEYDRLRGFLNSEFENNTSLYEIEPLTTTYNGIKSTCELDRNATDVQILMMTNHHNQVVVNDDEGIEHGYIPQVIASLRKQNQKANNKIAQLQEENTNLERKKKQYGYVILLALGVIGCGIGLFLLNDNLNLTRLELTQANDSIREQEAAIGRLDSTVELQTQTIEKQSSIIESKNKELKNEKERYTELEGQYANLEERHSNLKDRYSNLESSIVSVAPFVITRVDIGSVYKNGNVETNFGNTLYKSRARYMAPKIYYRGFTSGSYTIKYKWYNPSGSLISGTNSPSGYTQSYNCYIQNGSNSSQLSGWGWENPGNWNAGTYKLELWCNGRCYFVKSFTVYD